MTIYLAGRLAWAVIMILVISILAFGLHTLAPGAPGPAAFAAAAVPIHQWASGVDHHR